MRVQKAAVRQRPFKEAAKEAVPKESGVNDHEEPPVPIPNTEVKLMCVENTWLATAWEDRSMPELVLRKLWKGLSENYL